MRRIFGNALGPADSGGNAQWMIWIVSFEYGAPDAPHPTTVIYNETSEFDW